MNFLYGTIIGASIIAGIIILNLSRYKRRVLLTPEQRKEENAQDVADSRNW